MIGGYSGAALAFTTALFWDRHSRLQDEVRQTEAERRRVAERLQQEQERRVVEAKRRFGALELELERLKASIERTKREQADYKHFFPDLPTGSWAAASGPLGRDRLRLRADGRPRDVLRPRRGAPLAAALQGGSSVDEDSINPIIATFVSQMADAVDVLLEQVREQIMSPQVEQIVGARRSGRPGSARTRQFTGAIRAQTPEEIAKALAGQSLPGLEGRRDRVPDGGSARIKRRFTSDRVGGRGFRSRAWAFHTDDGG